jgi:YVTN family beta-propeller protein
VLVGPSPNYVAVNPYTNAVYVTNADATLSVINGSTNKIVATVEIGGDPAAIVVNPDSNLVYVSHPSSGTISIIDGKTYKVLVGVTFSVNPSDSGQIICEDKQLATNAYYRIEFDGPPWDRTG